MYVPSLFRVRYLLLLGVLSLLAAACSPAATATPTPAAGAQRPDTNASSVFEHLRTANYQETWQLWPDKGKLYQGAEPHGMLLTTYLNDVAMSALSGDASSFPDGSIIVKENYTPDGVLDATTVMYKVAGYNAEHNDWFWAKVLADGTVDAEGQVEGCQACHMSKRDNDYIWTSPLN
jgi:hypothetical protein